MMPKSSGKEPLRVLALLLAAHTMAALVSEESCWVFARSFRFKYEEDTSLPWGGVSVLVVECMHGSPSSALMLLIHLKE